MGRIKKAAGPKHEATVSPAISDFVKKGSSLPISQLPIHLRSFPQRWPLPRGDLYHWIPLLNRFDAVLEQLIKEYSLEGPQARAFGSIILERGIPEENKDAKVTPTTRKELDSLGFQHDGDRELAEDVLNFSRTLLESCGNRSLYASSERLGNILNTTSLSLLSGVLQLMVRLAQRFHASRSRSTNPSQGFTNALLASHYNIDLERVQKLAEPFPKPNASRSRRSQSSSNKKGKEKAENASHSASVVDSNDFLELLRGPHNAANGSVTQKEQNVGQDDDHHQWEVFGDVSVDYFKAPSTHSHVKSFTPTTERRASSLSHQRRLSNSDESNEEILPPNSDKADDKPSATGRIEIQATHIKASPIETLVHDKIKDLPLDVRFEVLTRLRVAYAMMDSPLARQELISIRLLALTNLAYIYTEDVFKQKILQRDSDEPRHLQLVQQLCDLLSPPSHKAVPVPLDLQTIALGTLEALAKLKSKAPDVCAALSVNVNHGVLFHLLQSAVNEMRKEVDDVVDVKRDDWREAGFALLETLPSSAPRMGEALIGAGLLNVLVEVINLRTPGAERSFPKTLTFLNSLVAPVRDAFETLAQANGLEAISALMDHQVKTAIERAQAGQGLPPQYRNRLTDYQIPFYNQQTLRMIFKITRDMMTSNNGNLGRLLRNFIESPNLLNGLKTVMVNPSIFGSVVWSGAVNIMSSFIHNEPTSYTVVSEAGLSKGFLETVSTKLLIDSEDTEPTEAAETSTDAQRDSQPAASEDDLPDANADAEQLMAYFTNKLRAETFTPTAVLAKGILPAADAIISIPHAIGALCLNHSGMELLKKSNVLDNFFDIFESPTHVRTMTGEGDLAQILGQSFDELVRHHPTLKIPVLSSLLKMINRIKHLCLSQAGPWDNGARLWTNGPDGQLLPVEGTTQSDDDIVMKDVSATESSTEHTPRAQSSNGTESLHGIGILAYIGVAMKFLGGFTENPAMCNLLVESGATDLVLELATLPVLQYDCSNHFALVETRRVLHSFSDAKAHLVLPAVVQHTQSALAELQPLLNHDESTSFFAEFTTPLGTSNEKALTASNAQYGTVVAQSLVKIQNLCLILKEIFSQSSYHPRSQPSPINQVNLSDIYVQIVGTLGNLHRICVWEEILLMRRLPASWMKPTAVKGFSMGSAQADQVIGLTDDTDELAEDTPHSDDPASTTPSGPGNVAKKGLSVEDEKSAAFKNAKILRCLLSQAPSSMISFFQNLGKSLLGKRRSHSYDSNYSRQNANIVANAISQAYMEILKYEPPRKAGKRELHSYWIVVLTSVSRLMIEGSHSQGQVLTLLLRAFKRDGGLDIIKDILQTFHSEVETLTSSSEGHLTREETTTLFSAYQGVQVILNFYKPILTSKAILDSSQSTALSGMDNRLPIAFNPLQFLMEVRSTILPVVKTLWESTFVEKASSTVIKSVIEIMRIILEASDEHGAPRVIPEKPNPVHKKYEINQDKVQSLNEKGFENGAAREALYRCFNDVRAATVYCQRLKHMPAAVQLPIPDYDNDEVRSASESNGTPLEPSAESSNRNDNNPRPTRDIDEDTSEAAAGLALLSQGDRLQPPSNVIAQSSNDTISNVSQASSETPAPPPAPGPPANAEDDHNTPMHMSLDNLQNMLPDVQEGHEIFRQLAQEFGRSQNLANASQTNPQPMPSTTETNTIDKLADARADVRKNLIDRALDILNAHDDVTFELADLISAATSKASDVNVLRVEIGTTLTESLASFELNEDYTNIGKKVASYANLLALVLQNPEFFEACSSALLNHFDTFISFVKLPTDATAGMTSTPWISQTLLVIEKILSEDAQPPQVKYSPSGPDGKTEVNEILDYQPPLVSGEAKNDLFEALLKIMPCTGKDESMVLSITRVLVILTRDREIASKLAEKKNIQRFFLMIKQLCGIVDDKLPSAVMIVVRHMFENDEILRKVMRSEIRKNFESRSRAPLDVPGFARHMSHLAIRSPQIFIEVSNEVVEIGHYDASQRTNLRLIQASEDDAVEALQKERAEIVSQAPVGEDQEMEDKPSASEPNDTVSPNKAKQIEKPPAVEQPSGVIHYLLSELLSYKETDDSASSTQPKLQKESSSSVVSKTQSLPNGSPSSPHSTSPDSTTPTAAPSTTTASDSNPKKVELKPEDHPIHTYRCFILQCLTEMLRSYNQAKIEFINFSRKADAKASTPSKPRSGVLNYLLNDTVPVGSVQHEETVSAKKREATSNWSKAVIVALCMRTDEDGYDGRDFSIEEDQQADLVFVRKFVLEHALKAFKDSVSSDDDLSHKYDRMLNIAELFSRLISGSILTKISYPPVGLELGPQKAIAKLMFEKGFIAALTSSIADINLDFKGADRTIKYILRPLKHLTSTAVELSESSSISTVPGTSDEGEISSATSVSDVEDGREETPDLFRNSTLAMFEPNREDGSSSDGSRSEDDEMYDEDGYDDEMDYEDGGGGTDPEDVISDEDDELGEVGAIEGIDGNRPMDIIVDEEDDEDDSEDDEDDLDDEDIDAEIDPDMDEDEEDDMGDLEEINGDDENASLADDDGGDWEDEDDFDQDGDDDDPAVRNELEEIETEVIDALRDGRGPEAALQRLEGIDGQGRGPADLIMDIEEGNYMEDVVPIDAEEDNDGEDDEDEDDDADEETPFEDFDSRTPGPVHVGMPDPPWGWDDGDDDSFDHGHHHHRHHHHHHMPRMPLGQHRHLPDPWTIFPGGPPGGGPRGVPLYRSHRATGGPRSTDDGTNPLLQRGDRTPGLPPSRMTAFSDAATHLSDSLLTEIIGGRGVGSRESPAALIHHLLGAIAQGRPGVTAVPGPGGNLHIQVTGIPGDDDDSPAGFNRSLQTILSGGHIRGSSTHRAESRQPVAMFVPQTTSLRWTEEGRLLFGNTDMQVRGGRVANALLRLLVPPAIERKKEREAREKRLREEAERLEKEKQERLKEEERVAKEEKARQEAEAAEAAAAQAKEAEDQASAQAEAAAQVTQSSDAENASHEEMEGVEQTGNQHEQSSQAAANETEQPAEPTELQEPAQRQFIDFNGTQLDITGLGIDREYLEALPEDMRNEVLMQQVATQRAQTSVAGDLPTDIDNEFLEALPPEIRAELLQHEAQERRRREREEARRQQQAAGGTTRAEEMDPASFFASLDPIFRQTVLMEQDDDILAQLPPDLAAEARALAGDRGLAHRFGSTRMNRAPTLGHDLLGRGSQSTRKPPKRQIVQMLDKPGIATLLRLMFIQQQSPVKMNLQGILNDVIQNRQSRSEVINLLLTLLHDGSTDASAIERTYAQLTARSKTPASARTPLKRTITDVSSTSTTATSDLKIAPLMVIQQCLSTLNMLTNHNSHVNHFFLQENDLSITNKTKTSKKGKGKENKAAKYPINALLSLLGRPLVTDNMSCVEQLAGLLQRTTYPLTVLMREKEAAEEAKRKSEESKTSDTKQIEQSSDNAGGQRGDSAAADHGAAPSSQEPDISQESIPAVPDAQADTGGQQPTASSTVADAEEKEKTERSSEKKDGEPPKKTRTFDPPVIPQENLALVINIITARECPSATFRATLSTMTNLSTIPDAKDIFGKRLVSSALELADLVLSDLNELIPQIKAAASGNELQALALTKFSPQSSDQAKLLRVLKALDYLFDPKREESKARTASNGQREPSDISSSSKADIITTLYETGTFATLWERLSECLRAIHQGKGLLNVATILLPLVEALMVVCTNTTMKETAMTQSTKDFTISSPAPETHLEMLFFRFTEDHRKILNELVRHNPKLMSGTFQLLVKNPKVLEFDNKRNYFNRRLHQRNTETRHPQPPLQLNVRRDQVFLDSFKFLSFKSGDVIKYGKLNIRFTGEEGVDAGGVTREWFQAMSRQMFNPDYALFIPVASDRTTFHPNKLSKVNEEHLMFFEFIGRIIGKALYEGRALDCHFSRAVYKRILGRTVSIKDMETLDLDYYKSLLWMLENDITEIITETMSVETDDFGVTEIVDLVPNGRNIPVTEENKQEYVQLVVEHRLVGSVQTQLEKFLGGFHDIVPPELISIFNEQELELLISGLPDIDVDDWKGHTDYHNYQAASPQIQWFWRAVRSFDKEERAKLLQFVTGTSKVPLNGFGQLEGMNGFSRFNIHRDYGNKDRLPSSHTCFNQLDLPEYEDYESLRKQLYMAMTAGSEYFGFA